jgi:hypothetical protein
MQYLLPKKFHGYDGKKHGIIDTGKTIEFWCTQSSVVPDNIKMSLHDYARLNLCRAFVMNQDRKKGHCMNRWQHFVTLNIHPSLGKELGVFLHIKGSNLMSTGTDPSKLGYSPEYEKELLYMVYLGVVPHNHNIHKLLSNSLHVLGRGRVHKVQVRQSPCSLKVILPYGPYRFNDKSELTIESAVIPRDKFDHLMLSEDE